MDKNNEKRANALRTPDSCFDFISDFPFEPHYCYVDGYRIHYLDENSNSNKVLVLLHGEPSWSYTYRKLIPYLTAADYRVIVPDLIGFGKSDKPTEKEVYSYSKIVEWMSSFLFDQLNLNTINLVAHDWGGLIGFRIIAENEECFHSIIAMNTAFPRAKGFSLTFAIWRLFRPLLIYANFSKLVPFGVKKKLSKEELAAYQAPFPNKDFKVGPSIFPKLVPAFPWDKEVKENKVAWEKLGKCQIPLLTIFSNNDRFTKGIEKEFIEHIPGAKDQMHVLIDNAGHFLQEDQAELISQYMLVFLKQSEV